MDNKEVVNAFKINTISDKKATEKVEALKTILGVDKLCIILEISRMTVYSRLKTKKWKTMEKLLIEKL